MAETTDSRIHPATPRKRQQARDRGQAAKSSDLTATVMLGGMLLTVLVIGPRFAEHLKQIAHRHLGESVVSNLGPGGLLAIWHDTVMPLGSLLIPAVGFLLVLPLGVHLMQTRFLFYPAGPIPDWSRIGTSQGLRQIFSTENATRTGFGLAKILVIVGVVCWGLFSRRIEIINLATMTVGDLTSNVVDILFGIFLEITAVLFIIGIFDFFYQRRKFERSLMMTTEELRDELRQQQHSANTVKRPAGTARLHDALADSQSQA